MTIKQKDIPIVNLGGMVLDAAKQFSINYNGPNGTVSLLTETVPNGLKELIASKVSRQNLEVTERLETSDGNNPTITLRAIATSASIQYKFDDSGKYTNYQITINFTRSEE